MSDMLLNSATALGEDDDVEIMDEEAEAGHLRDRVRVRTTVGHSEVSKARPIYASCSFNLSHADLDSGPHPGGRCIHIYIRCASPRRTMHTYIYTMCLTQADDVDENNAGAESAAQMKRRLRAQKAPACPVLLL